MPDASFRYYFTLDSGETPSQVTLSSSYSQCQPATGPTQYAGSTYYVQVSCGNLNIEPAGEADYSGDDYQAQVQFRITFPAAHNPAEDWSFQGIPPATGATPVTVSDMTLYSGNTLVWGTPPPAASAPSAPSTTSDPSATSAPSAPGALKASAVTPTTATLSWTASAAGSNPVAGYDVYTSAGTLAGTTTSTSFALTSLNGSRTTPYGYYVQAVDSQGLASPASNIAQFITSPDTSLTASDALPPSEPGTPTASSVTSTGATLTWGASVAGTGTLAGYRLYELAPAARLVATTTGPSYTLTGLSAGTAYAYAVEAVDGQDRTSQFAAPATFYTGTPGASPTPSATSSATPSTSPTPTASPTSTTTPTPTASATASGSAGPLSCSAAYSLVNSWSGGFQAQVTLTNTGSTAISAWTLAWTFPGDQQISSLWSASYVQTGEQVSATAESYNATIAPAGSVTVGFTGTYKNSNAAPTSFTVNGSACS